MSPMLDTNLQDSWVWIGEDFLQISFTCPSAGCHGESLPWNYISHSLGSWPSEGGNSRPLAVEPRYYVLIRFYCHLPLGEILAPHCSGYVYLMFCFVFSGWGPWWSITCVLAALLQRVVPVQNTLTSIMLEADFWEKIFNSSGRNWNVIFGT